MLSRLHVYHELCRQLRLLLPQVRLTQLRGLGLLLLGVAWTTSVSLPTVAAALPLSAHPASTERRLRRWLANERLGTTALWAPIRRALLAHVAGQEVVLVFDPTPFQGRWSLLCLGLIQGKRALPLAWTFQPLRQAWDTSLTCVLEPLCRQVATDLPAGCRVTLVADRGLVGPGLVDLCTALGWDLVLRLRASAGDTTRIRLADGTVRTIGTLVEGPGQRWQQPVWLFKRAGWRQGWLTIHWARRYSEPWVLFSTRPGGLARVREYRRRCRVEATYQDLKGRGLRLERTRLGTRARVERLMLVVVLAYWWLMRLGDQAVARGERRRWDRPDRCTHSRLRLGQRLLHTRLAETRPPPLLLSRPQLRTLTTPAESVR